MKSIYIGDLSYALRLMIGSFLVVLSVGFFTGISFVGQTDSMTPEGMVENYNGNADQDDAMVMKFKKSPREMLTIIHTHVLSLSFIFFLTGVLLGFSRINKRIQIFLMVEPFVSVLLTFGGIYLVWLGYEWVKYIVIISGTAMTIAYIASVLILFSRLNLLKGDTSS
jgi:hypothetical protein